MRQLSQQLLYFGTLNKDIKISEIVAIKTSKQLETYRSFLLCQLRTFLNRLIERLMSGLALSHGRLRLLRGTILGDATIRRRVAAITEVKQKVNSLRRHINTYDH